jgi:hypothetical protein
MPPMIFSTLFRIAREEVSKALNAAAELYRTAKLVDQQILDFLAIFFGGDR